MTEFHGEIFTAIQIQTRAFNLVSFPNPLVLEVKWVSETEQANPLLLFPELSCDPPHPLFQITPVLNTGLSLSEPLQLYKGYNAI